MRSSNSSGNGGSEQCAPNISMVGVGGICRLLGFLLSRDEHGPGTVHGRKNQSKIVLSLSHVSYPLAPSPPTPGSMLMESAG